MPVQYGFGVGGEDGGTVVHVRAREALSEPYEAALTLALPLHTPIPDQWLGRPATLTVQSAALSRELRGVVRRVEDLGSSPVAQYVRAWVVPSLWLLSQRGDVRIFQAMNVASIVREVLRGAGLYQGDGRLVVPAGVDALPPREYCVQYRERDLDFVRRLLQEEGIPFWFEHEGAGGESLVLGDDSYHWEAAATWDGNEEVPLRDEGWDTAEHECLARFDWRRELRPTGTTLRDFDFTRPNAVQDLTPEHPASTGARAIYDYPARLSLQPYDEGAGAYRGHDGTRQARVRHELEQSDGHVGVGMGTVTGFQPGAAFRVSGHARSELDRRYALTEVEHEGHAWGDVAEDLSPRGAFATLVRAGRLEVPGVNRAELPGDRYVNRFECVPAEQPWRPARVTPRPLVHGTQTATVVGPEGEEIYTDLHGRVKLQFHWDRVGERDERSSCWVRVAQLWAGAGWGAVFLPRVGMEVLVTFLEGDPDRPLVVGCVYNGVNPPPYALPGEKTKSTIKTNSSPTSGGYNELRFEDRTGSEQVYLQAERDWDSLVKHDQTLTVGRHRTKLVRAMERNTIGQDRTTTVQQNDALTVEGNRSEEVHGYQGSTLQVDAAYHVSADEQLTLTVGKSKVVMNPQEIVVTSKVIRVLGEKLVEIKGGLVKINCPDGPKPPSQKKQGKAARAMAAMKRGMDAALAKLPAPLRKALRRAGRNALSAVMGAVASGKMPDFGAIARGAAGTALGGAMTSAMGAFNQGFGALMQLPAVQGNPLLAQMAAMGRDRAMHGLERAVGMAGALRGELSGDPAWQRLQRDDPATANAMLRRMVKPQLRAELMRVPTPRGVQSGGTVVLDGVTRAGLGGLRAGVG